MKSSTNRLLQPFLILIGIITGGIAGYMIIESASLLDSLYMTIISITTVGYGEIFPLSNGGRIFTMILLVTSWLTFAFALTRITEFVIKGEINKYFKTRRLMKEIAHLHDHVIICGYGRNGHEAAKILKAHRVPYIVIEKNHALIDKSANEEDHLLHLEGDSTEDHVLLAAGIVRAKALVITLPVDADNLFIVLSARELNPHLQIISRASDHNSINKLKKAGANNVVMPDRIGGSYMANLVSKPDVVEFMNFLSGEEGQTVNIDSVSYEDLPEEVRGKPLNEVMHWKKTGVTCIGVKSAQGKFEVNPPEDFILYPGMKVILLGTINQLNRMRTNLVDKR